MPGYDFLLQAMGGLMSVTGEPDGRPLKAGTAVVDLVCGLLAANGIQAALVERARTGRGRHVEVSLMDSALTCLLNQGTAWVAAGVRGRRRGNRHPSIVPYETYETADRPIAIAVGNERIFVPPVRGARAAELPQDERFAAQRGAGGPRRRTRGGVRGRAARRARRALADASCARRRCPAGPINEVDEAFALAEELGMEPVEDVDGLPVIRPPLRIDGERPPVRRPPPRLDEHGGDLQGLAYRTVSRSSGGSWSDSCSASNSALMCTGANSGRESSRIGEIRMWSSTCPLPWKM